MADFHETARIKIKELSAKKPAVRRAAAYYLGEAGVDEAITKLVNVYKSDPDASVRKAAEYALGMFKAVEEALARGDEETVVTNLRRVVDEGKLGKRLSIPTRRLARIEGALGVLFAALVILNFVLPGLSTPGAVRGGNSVEEAVSRETVAAQMRLLYDGVRNDATTLQTQFQRVLGGASLDCSAFFNEPSSYVLPPSAQVDFPDLVAAVEILNAARGGVAAVKTRFDQACFEDQAVTSDEVGEILAPLVEAMRLLPVVESTLLTVTEAPSEQPAPQATTTSAPEPTAEPPTLEPPTVEPTAIAASPLPPTATPAPINVIDVRGHLAPLYGIIDNVSAPRGALGLLHQYWTDAARAGATDACDDPTPEIPDSYVLPPTDAAASAELAQAVEQVNFGLDRVRQGWTLFRSACDGNALYQNSPTGLQAANEATSAFRNADSLLVVVRNGA